MPGSFDSWSSDDYVLAKTPNTINKNSKKQTYINFIDETDSEDDELLNFRPIKIQKTSTKTSDKDDPNRSKPKTDNQQQEGKSLKNRQLFDQNNDLKIWKDDQYPLGFNQMMYYAATKNDKIFDLLQDFQKPECYEKINTEGLNLFEVICKYCPCEKFSIKIFKLLFREPKNDEIILRKGMKNLIESCLFLCASYAKNKLGIYILYLFDNLPTMSRLKNEIISEMQIQNQEAKKFETIRKTPKKDKICAVPTHEMPDLSESDSFCSISSNDEANLSSKNATAWF